MPTVTQFTVLILFLLLFASCGKKASPLSPQSSGCGDVAVSISLAKPASLAKVSQTVWNRVIIQISAPDIDTLRDTAAVSASQLALIRTIPGVRAGANRKVQLWTENISNQKIIHICPAQLINIIENKTTSLSAILLPIKGSIYFDFWDIDARIDSVTVQFCTATDTLFARGGKGSGGRIMLSIDYIPDGSNGTINVFGIDCAAIPYDTLYEFHQSYLFHANSDSSLFANFTVPPGSVSLNITFNTPGITVVQGTMNSLPAMDSVEQGPIFISEIMYEVNDSEYIELYNPLSTDTTFDTLIVEVNQAYRKFFNVTIKADSFFVIGRKALPFVDTYHSTASALDISSAGEFIALRKKDSTLMDCVYFTGSTNTQEWLVLGSSSRASIVLDSLGGPAYNNYGKHWAAAVAPIAGTGLKGTPRTRGK